MSNWIQEKIEIMKSSIFKALLISLILGLIPATTFAATIEEHWHAPTSTTAGQLGVIFDDRVDYFYIGALTGAVDDGGYKSVVCSSLDDEKCTKAAYFSFKAMLKPCGSASEINCIGALTAIKADGSKITGTFSRYVTTDKATYWDGSVSAGVPDSRAESLWKFPGLTHAAGSEFLVSSILDGVYKKGITPRFGRLQSIVQPVSEVKDADIQRVRAMNTSISFLTSGDIANLVGWTGGQKGIPSKNCAASDDGICFQREAFPADVKYSISIRLSQSIGGWIHGRMKTPEISIVGSGSSWNIDVSGEPITVPVVAYWGNKSDLSSEIQSAYSTRAAATVGITSGGTSLRYQTNGQFNLEQINLFSLWTPLIKDKASANPKVWMYGSLSADNFASAASGLTSAKECVTKTVGLAGLVTTNATVYDGSMPTFDAKEGVLNYKVAAPHYAADGTEFSGTYDLIMKSEVARCIYGFTAAPVSASVEVTSSNGGIKKVATTLLNERNGWLNLGAYGFTFSSPTLRVKLSQVATVPTPTPSATPAVAKPVAVKKSSITCVKGKTSKKVTAVNPKCPTGYKKK